MTSELHPLAKQILESDDIERIPVECPEWGVTLYAESLSAATIERYQQAMQNTENARMAYLLIVFCIRDENRQPVFTLNEIDALRDKNSNPVERLLGACLKVCGQSSEVIEDAIKN